MSGQVSLADLRWWHVQSDAKRNLSAMKAFHLDRHAYQVSAPQLAAVFAIMAMAASQSLQAQTETSAPLWEVGGFTVGVSQQAYPGSDQQVNRSLALPLFVYRGELLRADRETAGIRAIRNSAFELDIGVAGSFGARSEEIEARRGMRELGTLVEFGPRLKWQLGTGPGNGRWRAELPLRGVFDLRDSAAYRGLAFEPKLVFERQTREGWRYNASLAAIIADLRLAQTFYEVNEFEATPLRPEFAASNGLIAWRLAASFSRNLAPDWRLFGFARVDTVAGAANENSPLVRKTTGTTMGLGIAYTWQRSTQRASE